MSEVVFDSVFYTYSPKSPFSTEALKDISFSFDSSDFVALVGRTGSGKSTIIEHLNALLRPTKGEVRVAEFINSSDKKRRTKKLGPLRKKVGLVFQFSEYQLFEDKVIDDVSFGPRNFGMNKEEATKAAKQALAMVGLDESFYERSPFDLSGGEKRRAAIAGILAMDSDILVFDEPTSGLDPVGAKEMMELFRKLNEEGKGIVLVTHDMDIVLGYAHKAILIDKGKIIKIARPSELFSEDLEAYGLEKPRLYALMDLLIKKGMKLDVGHIHTPGELAKAIKESYE